MQYVTTRSDRVLFNERDPLYADTAPDGGYFVPAVFPKLTREEIISLQQKSYGDIIADVLNRFFAVQLTGWDVDLHIGRNSARIASLGSKTYIAEMWHNPTGTLQTATKSLYACVTGSDSSKLPTQWFQIAADIAYLFALYGELSRTGVCVGGTKFDVSVNSDDMILPLVACYAREMGLPIGTILISCNDSVIWDLIHRGESNASSAAPTVIAGIERLVHLKVGGEAIETYLTSITNKRTYFVDEELIPDFGDGLFCVVSGAQRYQQIIGSFAMANRYILDPCSAQCVNALQDYRAKTGANHQTLIISATTPLKCIADITAATGLNEQSIAELLKRQ